MVEVAEKLVPKGFKVTVERGKQSLSCYCSALEYLDVAEIMGFTGLPSMSATVRYLLNLGLEVYRSKHQPPLDLGASDNASAVSDAAPTKD